MKFYIQHEEKSWSELTRGQQVGFVAACAAFTISTVLQVHDIVVGIRESRRLEREIEQASKELRENISEIDFFGVNTDKKNLA